MSTVILRHSTLPDTQEIEVDAAALPHYTGAGWQQVPAEELEQRAAMKAKAAAEAAAAEETAPEPADEPEQSEPAEPTDRPARSRTKTAAKKTEEES